MQVDVETRAVGVVLCCVLLAGCSKSSPPPLVPEDDGASSADDGGTGAAWFADEAAARGLGDFVWMSGHVDEPRLPEIVGGGAALFDMDGDGDLDAYLVQAGALSGGDGGRMPNELWRNDGGGRFERVEDAGDAGDRGYGMGGG